MKKLQRPEHQRLILAQAAEKRKTQQLQWARYRHFLHDGYENPNLGVRTHGRYGPDTQSVTLTDIVMPGGSASSPITYVPPSDPWVPVALRDPQPLSNPDMIKGSARQTERALAQFLAVHGAPIKSHCERITTL